jgi:hypothetical protein
MPFEMSGASVVTAWVFRVSRSFRSKDFARAVGRDASSIYPQETLADQRQCASNALLKSARSAP